MTLQMFNLAQHFLLISPDLNMIMQKQKSRKWKVHAVDREDDFML